MIIPPPPFRDEERERASVVWDALALDRRAEVAELLEPIIRRADEIYVGWFGGDRRYTPSVCEWVTRRDSPVRTLECRFCREILDELRRTRRPGWFAVEAVDWATTAGQAHGERCAAGVVARLVEPRAVRAHRKPRARDVATLPVYFEIDPARGDVNYDVPVTIWGEGFRRAKRIRVMFGDKPARIAHIASDHQMIVIQPYVLPDTCIDIVVMLDATTIRLAKRFYVPPPPLY